MKTLVVLSALAAVALAAPTLLEQGSKDFKKFTNVPETFKRERKSTQESSITDLAPGAPANLPSTSHVSEFGVSGRSFGLQKPSRIIIKKKPLGYQVYRDSDEVPADSGETCGSQVKVKFCDGKAKLKTSTTEDSNTQMTEEDMKHSITIAKEAIENLQRDLNTVEGKPGTQASSWNHGHSESDVELHQDIEVAREALEHIHNSFGNFESMSLQATTLDDAPKTPFTIAKTEEQRLAQWKEAIDTIQKNVEIAKNIEDSFKMVPESETGSLIANDMIENNKHELNKNIDHNLRTSSDVAKEQENKIESESCKTEHAHDKSNENTKDKLVGDDMSSSASTISEKKMNEDQMKPSLLLTETETGQSLKAEQSLLGTPKEKKAGLDTMILNDISQKNVLSMESVEDSKEKNDKKIMVAKSAHNIATPTNEMKSVESEDMSIENQKKAAVSTESLETLETVKEKHLGMKSAEHIDDKMKDDKTQADLVTEQSKQIDTTLFAKSAEEVTHLQQELLADPKMQRNMAVNEPEKNSAETKMVNNEDLKNQQEILSSVNNVEHMEMQQHQTMFHPDMRTTEDLKNMHQQLIMNPQSLWAEDKNMHLQRESMTSANGVHSHTVQHPGHHHHVTHGMNNHHFDVPTGQAHHPRFPDNFMTQEKSADPDMQAYYMSMRDGSGLVPENRFRWKPTHEGPRSAYGAPVASSGSPQNSGAVGLFPNANLGGCGIPLLLSCNPSVVSGSLAKPAPAPYSPSAPAYRTEDEFTFHTKRDVKKNHENLSSPLLRTPKANMKTSTVLVAKQ